MMDDADTGQYKRTRVRRAKRLVAEYLSHLESLEKKGPDEEELLRKEKERIAALIIGRRQREAKLVGEFDSDEIYDPDDEGLLSMREAQQESRRRIRDLCVGRKLADCTTLLIDDLIRELRTFMTSCSLFVGLVQPGRNATEVIFPSSGARNMEAVVRRDGGVEIIAAPHAEQSATITVIDGADAGADATPRPQQDKEGSWERTATGSGQLPNPEIVFKCVDAETAVVVGTTVDEREGRFIGDACPDENETGAASDKETLQDRLSAVPSSFAEGGTSRNYNFESRSRPDTFRNKDDAQGAASAPGATSTATDSAAVTVAGDRKGEGNEENDDHHRTLPPRESRQQSPLSPTSPSHGMAVDSRESTQGSAAEAARPQVWVPLTGAGDSGCIGMIGVQGFTTGALVDDDDWRDWFMHRMKPLNRGENRNVKRLRLVRPRGLPDKGRLENVPTGVAAKVVYGSVEKISRKRRLPVYAVRWEDGLLQLDVPKRYMRQFVAEDDASAGKGIPLTADVVQHLTWIGRTVGPVLDEVRKAIHLNALSMVTLAEDARHRDVVEQALRSLVACLPSIDAVEVWQLDSNSSIRCVQGLAAAEEGRGKIYRSNERVNSLLQDDDVEDLISHMEPVPVDGSSGKERGESKSSQGKREKESTNGTKPKSATRVNIPEGLVIRPKQTSGVIAAAPFRDYSFKVGRSWIGADRLARGFALVLRENVKKRGPGGTAVMKTDCGSSGGAAISIPQRSGIRSNAGSAVTEAGTDDESKHSGNGHVEDGDFAARVARELGVALACVRGREKRMAIRVQALRKLSEVCMKDRPSGKEAKEAVLAEISAVLPGCRAYIGVLQPGGRTLLYESATSNSTMKGRELRRGEGISFHCLDDPEGQIRVIQHRDGDASGSNRARPEPPSLQASAEIGGTKPPTFSVGDRVEVWYASSWFYASIIRAWGHDCYDVRYEEFRETEAGVPGWRLREVVTLEHLNVKLCWEEPSEDKSGDGNEVNDDDSIARDAHRCSSRDNKIWPWPFVCVPLRSAGTRVGVLGVDGWSDVELGRPEEVHPENAVISFLHEAGSLLANALYTERRDRGLSALGKTLRGQDTTQNGALEALIMLLRETVTFRTRIDVLETRAADPGLFFCRGTWEDTPQSNKQGDRQGGRQGQAPTRVFDVSMAPRVEELCLTPAQVKWLGERSKTCGVGEGEPSYPQKKQQSLLLKEITPYQREMYLIARDGPGAKNGLQARALTTTSQRGEIVGRFQRLFVRAGGGRPSADGWFLVRVGRALPEDAPLEPSASKSTKSRSQVAVARRPNAVNTATAGSEDGDVWLLSEMCRKLEVGFMAIAGREQRAVSRVKALDRVLNCCKGFNVAAAISPVSRSVAADDNARDRTANPAGRPAIGSNGEARISRSAATPVASSASGPSQPMRTVENISSGGERPATTANAGNVGGASASVQNPPLSPVVEATASSIPVASSGGGHSPPMRAMEKTPSGGGRPATKNNARIVGGASTSVQSPSSSPVVAATASSTTVPTSRGDPSQPMRSVENISSGGGRPATKANAGNVGGASTSVQSPSSSPVVAATASSTPVASSRGDPSQPMRTVENISTGGGRPATQNNAGDAGGASTLVQSPSSSAVVAAAASSTAATSVSPKELGVSPKSIMSAAAAVVVEEDRTTKTEGGLVFSTPVQPPTPAETSDGRKGALVTLKDARLAVLVYQGDKRVAVVEQPGGRQQVVPESEVVPGQSVFLRSGREALLVETIEHSNALVVVGTGGKANVVEETTKGKLRKLPLSVLKDFEAVAALAAGEGPPGKVTGEELVKEVIAAAQWVLPQVDIYVGDLSPFGESLNFTAGSSRSNASGKRIYRHSKPNGGPTFVDESKGDEDPDHVEQEEVQSPSWDVIDTCKNTVVRGVYSRDSSRMHFFSDPVQQGWPWVAVPIRPGPRSRAVRGVFCVDRFEDPWADEDEVLGHPEKDILSYLESCASALGRALDLEAKICALRTLRSVTLRDEGGDIAASTAKPTIGSAFSSALGKFGGGSGNDSGVLKNGAEDRGNDVKSKPATVSCAQDVYAVVSTTLSRALVHCKRFEVWEAVQPCDEQGRFFLEPSRAGRPPPFEAEDGDTREFLKLQITHCTGLAKADRFGLSDPFCIVKWPRNDQELGRTPTVYNTVHPVWKACFFELPLEAPAPAAPAIGEDSRQLACHSSGGRGSGGAGGEEGELRDKTVELMVQVWDEDEGAAADFLGELHFDAQALLDMAHDRLHLVLPLEAKHDGSMTKKQRELVQGSVGLRVSPATDGALSRLQESIDFKKVFLEVTIQGSLGLRQGDGACLFAIATLDGKDVGKTVAMPNGSDPVWMETVRIEFPRDRLRPPASRPQSRGGEGLAVAGGSDVPPSDFSVIVWSRLQEQGRSHRIKCAFVGRVDLSFVQLVEYTKEGGEGVRDAITAKTMKKTQHVPLKDRDGNYEEDSVLVLSAREASPSEWRAGLAEAASIGDSDTDAASVEASGLKTVFERRVRLTVLRATGLAQADDNGVADPMCVLRRRGREVGRTTTIYGSLDPVWGTKIKEGESFLLTIPHPREAAFGGGGVVVEVYDEDFGDPNDFLGQVTISGEELLRFHSPGTFRGPDAQNRQVPLQKKPEVPLSEQWLVQGDLFYRLEGVDCGDEEPEDAVVADLPRILDRSRQSADDGGGASEPAQSSQYRRIEIRVIEARGLAKADRFGLSDPYVVIYANGQTQLGRTRTIRLSLEPVWTNPEERFVVAVGLEDAAKCDLTLEVWDDDHLGQGDFLGQYFPTLCLLSKVSLPKVELLEYILPTGPIECELEKKNGETSGFNELVQGVLTFSIREAYSDMPDEPAEGEGSGGQVSLTVLSAKGLAKADVFGKSDPFAVVLLNRREVGRTRTLFKTLDPCWSEPRETFPLRIVGNRDRCNVAVQLWDEDLGRHGDFLGQASLGWADLELLPGEASRELNLTLGYRDGVPKRDQELVQGTIQMLVEAPVIEAKVGDGVARSYIVTVDRAWGLAKADRFGKADPFISIKVNGDGDEEERGQTHPIAGTLQPVWRNPPEVFILTDVEELILEVWDMDFLKKGEFLGEVRLSMQDLAEQVPVDGAHEFQTALQPKSTGMDKFNRLVQGSLRFTCQDWMSPDRLVLEGLGERLKLTVVSASGLPSGHHFGLFDPLACVRWNGLEIGRTRVVKKTTSPTWDEGFQISVPLESAEVHQTKGSPGNPNIEVVVEILDGGVGDSIAVPTTIAGTRSGVIGRIVLGERALRLPGPGDGPPCKVLELPIELPKSTTTRTLAKGRGRHVLSAVSNRGERPGTIILFLERASPPTKRSSHSPDVMVSSASPHGAPSAKTTPATTTAVAGTAHDTVANVTTTNDKNAESALTAQATASATQTPGEGGREQQTRIQPLPRRPSAREKMQLKVDSAWGLSPGAKALDVVVTVMACGRGVGTTHVSSIGGTTSPEWIDERFILPVDMCAELSFEVWGRKMGNEDTFLGRACLRSTQQDMEKIATNGEPLELPLRRKSPKVLPLEDQTLAKGHLLFSLFPWHEFDYAGELDKSNANRGLQVEARLVGATNLTEPSASIFATFSFRGTELSKTSVVKPTQNTVPTSGVDGWEIGTASQDGDNYSHVWLAQHSSSTCTVPLPEGSVDRRETEIEIDLWEEGGPEKEHGDHLGQVVLSGDFVPHLAHGAVVCRPLRPQRSHGNKSNLAARGSLSFQLWLRRGGESLASEFIHSAVTVEVLAVKGLPPGSGPIPSSGGRRRAYCVVKEDGAEIGRTQASVINGFGHNTNKTENDGKSATISALSMPQTVSWEGENHHDTNQFAVSLSPHRGGGLPLQLTVEVWEISLDGNDDGPTSSRLAPPVPNATGDRRTMKSTSVRVGKGHSVRRIGSATIGPDPLLLSLPGRLTLPLDLSPLNPKGAIRRGEEMGNGTSPGAGVWQTTRSGARTARADHPTTAETTGTDALPPKIVLRVTPQVGVHWGRRVKAAAAFAKRVNPPPPPVASPSSTGATVPPITGSSSLASGVVQNGNDGLANVVYMTNAEGSARTWRAPVTPGSSIPPKDYEDALELVFGSVPACCPRAPALLVAPVSDIGVQLGQVWIGPRIAARHAIVAHRPHHFMTDSSIGNKRGDENSTKEGAKATPMGDVDSVVAAEPPREDELFMRMVAAEAEGLLRETRARDMRAEQRRVALDRVREICDAWTRARAKTTGSQRHTGTFVHDVDEESGGRRKGLSSTDVEEITSDGIDRDGDGVEHREVPHGDAGYKRDQAEGMLEEGEADEDDEDDHHLGGRAYGDLFRGVLRALELALPGVSIYLGLVEKGGESIRYVACTKQSSMAGKQLKKGEGISFCCVGPHYAPYIVYPPQRGGGPKRGDTRGAIPQPKHPTQEEEEIFNEHRTTLAEVVDAATGGNVVASARSKRPREERSIEEVVVSIQKAFRGKMCRDRIELSKLPGASKTTRPSVVPRNTHNKPRTSAFLIPKVFDYEGRVGWPFVCVPLEGFLRSSSIGVLGLDTFEQMGNSGSGKDQPETGVVQMVQEAARALGDTICCDRRRRALQAVAQSCLNFKSSVIDVLIATAKAAEESITSSSRAEVWKIDPSDGSLYVVTRRLPDPMDTLKLAERSSFRQLKVEVTAAELLPAITDYYETSPSAAAGPVRAIQSVAVRISTTGEVTRGRNSAFRTSPVTLKPLARSCSPQWYEGHRHLRVTKDSTFLAEIIAKVERGNKGKLTVKSDRIIRQRQSQQQQAPPAEGLLSSGRRRLAELGDDELVLAFASIDVNAVRDGYNYVQLFSPETLDDDGGGSKRSGGRDNTTIATGDEDDEDATMEPSVRPMGQLVLRLSWVEPGEGGGDKNEARETAGHATLVVHGASGLAKADILGESDPYCIVKWGGVELGRTKTCPNTHEPDWGKERFRLALPGEEAANKKERLPLVLEVWDEDAPGTKGDFLGQVVLQADELEAPAPGTRGIVLAKKPAAELKLSNQKLVRGMIEFSLETPRTSAAAETAAEEAAALCTGAGDGVMPIDTNTRDRSKQQLTGRVQASKAGHASSPSSVLSTSENVQSLQASSEVGTTKDVATASFRRRNKHNAEQRENRASCTIATGAAASTSNLHDGQRYGTEWEGVTWDEDNVPEAESLGSVSASLAGVGNASVGTAGSITLGTVELASKDGESTEPHDVLICLKGVAGVREAQTFGQSSVYCVIEVGNREVDRTRPLKHAPELLWEKPQERFRVAMEDVRHAISVPASRAYITPTATTPKSRVAMATAGALMASSEGEEDGASNAPSEAGTDVSTGETNDTAGPSLLSPPTLALDQAQRDRRPQQQVTTPASSLTVSVWSKGSAIGERHHLLLGRATVPAGYIDHPPGDVWLPLAGDSNSTSTTATNTSSGGEGQSGVTGPTAGREDAGAPALSTVAERPYTGAAIGDAAPVEGKKRGGTKAWGSGLFKRKGPRKRNGATELDQHRAVTGGSVHVWLGKARRGSLSGQQPGKGHAILRVHGASALRKADRHGSSDPKCFVFWNGEIAGSTSTIYNMTDPCWDQEKEAFRLRFPLDRSLCQLHVDVWDMDFAGTRKGDFLGRATLPTVMLLHPPPGGIKAPITIPLLPSRGTLGLQNANDSSGIGNTASTTDVEAAEGDAGAAGSGKATNTSSANPAKIPDKREHLHSAGKGTEGFATRLMHNVQKHLHMDDTITGTLTVSLEVFQFGDEEEGLAPGGGVREPGAPPAPAGYAVAKFKVAEDAVEARRRREREGIRVPRMLARVTELHDKLKGSVVTGPAAAGFSNLTEGAAAVIPEVLAGQILSLALRGSGGPRHTVLTANRDDSLSRDRLVVLLEPMPTDGHDSGGESDGGVDGDPNDHGGQRSRKVDSAAGPADQGVTRQRQRQRSKNVDLAMARADERPRHALVLPCVPGQISREDIAVATELARAADEAGRTIQKRRRRQVLMDRCAEDIEKLCRSRNQSYEGLFNDVISALKPVCCGAGAEVDRTLRDMPAILSVLTSGGYRLRVEASSPGWNKNADHQHSAAPVAPGGAEELSLCSPGGIESVGRWSGPLPMASGLVKRAVDRGDIFLVVENTVYVANVSWTGVWQETMPYKHVSSSSALKTSVALLREGIGPGISDAFILAPLWVTGVGCIGLITITDIPYATTPSATEGGGGRRRRPASRHHRQQHGGEQAPSGRTSDGATKGRCDRVESNVRHAVGPGVVEFARRVGVALGTAVFRLRKISLVARIRVEGARYSLPRGRGVGEHDVNQRLPLASPPLSPLRQAGQVGTSGRGTPAAREKRGIEGAMDASVVTCSGRREPGASPPEGMRPPETEEFDLSGWDSLEMTSVLRWPCPLEAVCKIYTAAITSLTEGLPWIRAADVWHVSSILEHEAVFTPEPNPIDNQAIVAGDTNAAGGDTESIGTLTVDSGRTVNTHCSDGARFCERVIGKTWSGYPAVVLRSLRVPGRDEAACTARWLRGNGEDGGGVFGDDEGWTDQRLRLLADEWRVCTVMSDRDGRPGLGSSVGPPSASPGASRRSVPRPFMLHTGHVIVPFLNGCLRESESGGNKEVFGHGVVLAVDRGVDWRRWESHLIETAVVATRCFERLERDGEVAERERVKGWKEELLHSQTRWYSGDP